MDIAQEAKIIREEWFEKHIAALTQHGDLQVLDWRKPGTNCYYCRYVFDGYRMYISGDIGEAVFGLTWKADVHSFDNVHLGYFHRKIAALRDEKYDFDEVIAVKRLREWVKSLKEDGVKYDHDEMRELFEEARNCTTTDNWAFVVNSKHDFISDLDPDYWEWIYSCGNKIPIEVHAYLIGLQMASEQLKQTQQEAV